MLALVLNIGMLVFAFNRNDRVRVSNFVILSSMIIFYVLGYFLEIRATTVGETMMALRIENIGIPSIAPFFLLTALGFFRPRMLRPWMAIVGVVYGLLMALIISFNELHLLYYSSVSMEYNGYYYVTVLGKGPLYILQQVVAQSSMIMAYVLLIIRFIQGSDKLRAQVGLFTVGTLFGFASNILNFAGIFPLGIDMTPFALTIGMLFCGIVLHQHKLMDIVPAAFDMAVETMDDALIVLDTDWGFIYCNQKAGRLYPDMRKYSGTEPIIQLPDWPDELCPAGEAECVFSITDPSEGKTVLQHVVVEKIRGKNGAEIGVMLKFHDVTEITQMLNRLEAQAITDPLTGVYNRRHFDAVMEQHMAMSSRHNLSLGMLLLDIDHFKDVNDLHGHLAGDHVLRAMAQALSVHLRSHDILARYGGEEFVVLSVGKEEADLLLFAERLRRVIENEKFLFNGKVITITASFGAVIIKAGHSYESAMESVDKALYQAKNNGRNRVALSVIEKEIESEQE